MTPIRLAVVVSHPIQYFVPLYRALARHPRIDLEVFYASRHGLAAGMDTRMGISFAWAADLAGGYAHRFLDAPEGLRSIDTWRGGDAPALGRHLAHFAPDAVLVHGYAHLVCLRALVWSSLRKVPMMLLADGSFDAGKGALRIALKRLLLPQLLRRIAAVFAMGERGAAFFGRWGVGPERLHRLPVCTADGLDCASVDARAAQREAWNAAPEDVVVLAVGKLYPEKRVHDLFEALALLDPASRSRVLCVIAGDGASRGSLEALARRLGIRARFTGFVNLDRLPAVYRAADIFVHPAEREQYGMAVLEAARAGLPLVVCDRVGALAPTDVARAGSNALAFSAGDVVALAGVLQTLVDDEPMRTRMAQASLAVSAHHTPANGAAVIVRALEKVLAS